MKTTLPSKHLEVQSGWNVGDLITAVWLNNSSAQTTFIPHASYISVVYTKVSSATLKDSYINNRIQLY